jgi:hypothetical protein
LQLNIRAGEQIGLFLPDGQPGGQSMCGFSSNDQGDVIRDNSPLGGEPPLGASVGYPNNEQGLRVNAQAVVEPDADADGFGDETQDQCPTNADTTGACPAVAPPAVTGQPAAALKKCKKKSKKARKKCRKKAKKLPV